jgi:hypothetical protein
MATPIQITAAQLIIAIVSAAGIGALTSSIITLLGQRLERKSRVKELLLAKSIEMAQTTTKLMFELGKELGGGQLYPEIVTARWYHRQLKTLFEKGTIDVHLEKEFTDYINSAHSEIEKRQNATGR